ncbi:DNA packaging tegument protein UL25 [Cervid alphaherpesvirus 2]|uniref:DNA packaging tegument protein UL25 n=1 Tax=Cervid alphaherpesvirus 2 TaxID=365327 RepID=A0A455JKE5_9ALPH|nr:DNA packaging tegument protein UL25 [Cervid alphaherpesvirus 2]AVT50755.1 DNA packaging tegument protein UL25 [Cervid alphaherpesvirus 2]
MAQGRLELACLGVDVHAAVSDRLFPADARNFIAPAFPLRFWDEPVFARGGADARRQQLAAAQARNRAAAAAADNMLARQRAASAEIDARIRPIEARVAEMAAVLAGLEEAARQAEEADAAAAEAAARARGGDDLGGCGAGAGVARARQVQIAKNDPPLEYDTGLAADLLAMVYTARAGAAGGAAGVVFGPWYRTLQERLVAERPLATRGMDYRDGRMSRTFMAATLGALQSCGRMYVGHRAYSAFECAVLCLHLAHRAAVGSAQYPVTFAGLVEQLPAYLEALARAVDEGAARRVQYAFDLERLPRGQFQAPGGGAGRYERGALEAHAVLATLQRLRVLPAAPGALGGGGAAPARAADADGAGYVDEVHRAAGAFLARAQNLFLCEDPSLLRATVDAITALLLVRRLLWNGNVYADRLRNNFQIGTLVPGAAPGAVARGADGGPDGAVAARSGDANLAFLCAHYVARVYEACPEVEVTQLFPGAAALALDALAPRAAAGAGAPRAISVAGGRHQGALLRLVALELENRHRAAPAPVAEVVGAHDAVALQYERGLGVLMAQPRLRRALDEARRLAQFNVASDYDLLYFLCLGFVPLFASAI